ncbi:hypothetical protein KGY71_01480, partial [Candidatus Bipolaricaulota bacterium]|nr:hypothetical protein [Candidatus Bipolaricaulota bacterium]
LFKLPKTSESLPVVTLESDPLTHSGEVDPRTPFILRLIEAQILHEWTKNSILFWDELILTVQRRGNFEKSNNYGCSR